MARTAPAAAMPKQITPESAELLLLTMRARQGDPRPYIETFFKIETEHGDLAPMLFENEPNQEYYYERLFGARVRWLDTHEGPEPEPWMVDALCLKDRKARWSAFMSAVLFAKMAAKPGTHVLMLVNAEDTFTTIHKFMDGFYKNMPVHARPEIKDNTWGVERKVFRFPTPDGGEVTSTFTVRTAANPNVGSGETPTDVAYDEYGKFPKTFARDAQASIRAAMSKFCSFWRGGTVGPDGPQGAMYEEIQQHQSKGGQRTFDYLFRTWYENPANILKTGDRHRRAVDTADEHIVPGVDAGPNGEAEPELVKRFPRDGIPVAWRLARRRSWMLDALLAAGGRGNEDAAAIIFAKEHCEDDVTPWLIAGRMQFDPKLMGFYAGITGVPTYVPLMGPEAISGLTFKAWAKYDPSHIYIGGLDLGSGSGGDDTSLQIMDFTANRTYMAELHGNVTDPVNAVAAAVSVMRRFGSGPLVIETNRFPGIGNYARKNLGYENTWDPPPRPGEKVAEWIDRTQKRHGIYLTGTNHGPLEPSAEEANAQFKAQFNLGSIRPGNPHLLQTMRVWNPEVQKHTPDRIAGARLCLLAFDKARMLQPVTGAPRPSPERRMRRDFVDRVASPSLAGVWGYR